MSREGERSAGTGLRPGSEQVAHLVHLVCRLRPDDVAEELEAKLLQLESGQVADRCGDGAA